MFDLKHEKPKKVTIVMVCVTMTTRDHNMHLLRT